MSLQLFPVVQILPRVPMSHLLRKMSSQRGAQKLFQELVSLLLFWLNKLALVSKARRVYNFESHRYLRLSSPKMDYSLNQTFLTYLLYMRQIWMRQLILAASLWGVIFPNPKGFCYSYACFDSSCEGGTSFFASFIHLCTVFDAISSKIDEVLSINSSGNLFVLRL